MSTQQNAALTGFRFRRGESVRIEVILVARLDAQSWRARLRPAVAVTSGDRLRFGDASESTACLLGFLDADVMERDGDLAVLSFALTGPFLDEAIARLRQP